MSSTAGRTSRHSSASWSNLVGYREPGTDRKGAEPLRLRSLNLDVLQGRFVIGVGFRGWGITEGLRLFRVPGPGKRVINFGVDTPGDTGVIGLGKLAGPLPGPPDRRRGKPWIEPWSPDCRSADRRHPRSGRGPHPRARVPARRPAGAPGPGAVLLEDLQGRPEGQVGDALPTLPGVLEQLFPALGDPHVDAGRLRAELAVPLDPRGELAMWEAVLDLVQQVADRRAYSRNVCMPRRCDLLISPARRSRSAIISVSSRDSERRSRPATLGSPSSSRGPVHASPGRVAEVHVVAGRDRAARLGRWSGGGSRRSRERCQRTGRVVWIKVGKHQVLRVEVEQDRYRCRGSRRSVRRVSPVPRRGAFAGS